MRHDASPTSAALPDLTVRQLEYLDAAVRAPTWARAAATLGVTPSALSQGLAELERRVGVPLFAREGRRRVPTEDAAVVVAHAQRVLAQTRDLARWAAGAREGRTGRLRVGMIDVSAIHHHADALRSFRADRPDVELRLAVAPSAELLAQLRRGDLDLVVCVAPDDEQGLDLVPLLDEPLVLYAPAGVAVGPADRWGPFVTFPEGSHTRAVVLDALGRAGAPLHVVAESHQPEVLAEMVRLGLGWTVLPPVQAEHGPDPLVAARRRPIATRSLVAVQRSGAIASPAASSLLALLRDHRT